MPVRDFRPVWVIAARTVVPAVLGALGALLASVWPAYVAAFCGTGA